MLLSCRICMAVLIGALLVLLLAPVSCELASARLASPQGALFPRGQIIGWWYKQKRVLNERHTSASGQQPSDAVKLIESLKKAMLSLKAEAIAEDGSSVAYSKIKASSTFTNYLELVEQLKTVSLSELSPHQRKAALINLYNCLIVHAILEGLLDVSGGTLARLKLYASASYNIGGVLYSLNDIENGLLRGNRKSAVPLTRLPFGKPKGNDPRLSLMLPCDPRIHFALNCGAVSCPPIGVYSSDDATLESQLTLATEGFLEETVSFDEEKKALVLSMLFSWYKEDFGGSDEQVVEWVRRHAPPTLRSKIDAWCPLVGGPATNPTKIAYSTYDWALNGSL